MKNSLDKVLVVAEEASQRFELRRTLEAFGFDLGEASNSAITFMRLRMIDYDAVLLHIAGPEAGGIALSRELRKSHPRLPVLIVSEFDSLDHKVEALEAGVDDYMIRPLAERELRARLCAAIRRSRVPAIPIAQRLVVGDIVLDANKRRVEKANSEIPLTPLEFRALHILMEQAGEPVPHAAFLTMLWGPERMPYRERLRVLIGGLRKKLEDDPAHPIYLVDPEKVILRHIEVEYFAFADLAG